MMVAVFYDTIRVLSVRVLYLRRKRWVQFLNRELNQRPLNRLWMGLISLEACRTDGYIDKHLYLGYRYSVPSQMAYYFRLVAAISIDGDNERTQLVTAGHSRPMVCHLYSREWDMKYIAFLADGTYCELDADDFHAFGEEVTITVHDDTGRAIEVRGKVEAIAAPQTEFVQPTIHWLYSINNWFNDYRRKVTMSQ